MTGSMRGPAIMLSQFIGDRPPFDSLDGIVGWAASLGYRGIQLPIHDRRIFDVERAAFDDGYCEAVNATIAGRGIAISELAAHRAGQLLAVHPALDDAADVFAPPDVRGAPAARRAWADAALRRSIAACSRLGVRRLAVFSGALAWPYFYPWPPAPRGLVDTAFEELARRWRPLLDMADSADVDLCFELHPGEDLHDGATFDRFLALVGDHRRARILYDPSHMLLQHMDYVGFIDRYHARIAAFHVKDAEFVRSDRSGVYGGYLDWRDRPGRFRSAGDGQIDFKSVFSRLAHHGYEGWAVLEWECCLKHPQDGAREGAMFIADHIIRVSDRAFDAALRPPVDNAAIHRMLGLAR
ncbi:MAG: sugar phosphate isomerase/epimerase [Alphaproteobacteria bacterium]|nr:sugar phosphate isomerase/epimerase [Alphaproteobacteria bacterium]